MAKGEWVFLRNWLRNGTAAYNQEVRDYFRDVPNTESSGRSPRAAALRACLIDSDDSGIVALLNLVSLSIRICLSSGKKVWNLSGRCGRQSMGVWGKRGIIEGLISPIRVVLAVLLALALFPR